MSVSVPLSCCRDDSMFIGYSEFRKVDSSSSTSLSQDCFDYSGSFVFHTNCEIMCSNSVKIATGI